MICPETSVTDIEVEPQGYIFDFELSRFESRQRMIESSVKLTDCKCRSEL